MKKIVLILSIYILPFLGLAQRDCNRIIPVDVNDLNLLMSSYIPDDNTPIKTIKMNFNIWRLDDSTGNYWIDTQEYRDTLQMIVDYLNYIYSNNDIFSDPVQGADFIPDTKVRFEIDTVYYINNSSIAYAQYVEIVNNYMLSLYPERSNNFNYHFNLAERLYGASGCSSGYHSDVSYPAILTYYQRIGINQSLWAFALHMAHEFGHNFGLNHPYDSEKREIQDPEFLWDLFGHQTQSWCNAPPTHVCYHDADWTCEPFDSSNTCTNNIMGGSYKARHFTALQCGRIHRALTVSCLRNYAYGYSSTPLVISTNTTWDVKMKFYQDIVIESGATLTVTCSLEMVSDAKIVVKSGGKLILDGGTLTNACNGELWRGIEVRGNPLLSQDLNNTNQGILILQNGAIIENAECGVFVGEKNTISVSINGGTIISIPEGFEEPISMSSSGGGIVSATNSSFINNKKAINFQDYIDLSNNMEIDNKSSFINCSFIVNDDALFIVADNESQVSLQNVKGVRFNGCVFEDAQSKSSLDNYGIGIYSYNAGICLNDNRSPFNPIPYVTTPCSFTGYGTAVLLKIQEQDLYEFIILCLPTTRLL